MGFLDNSGDIILDAVLTDAGRHRLARADGSFDIKKFALGDDEIDYSLYEGTHLSGAQYYDLKIMQTPVLEAFTNNTSTMNSKVITIGESNHFRLPVIKLFEEGVNARNANGTFVIPVDQTTVNNLTANNVPLAAGILNGFQVAGSQNQIRVDQGLDSATPPPTVDLQLILREPAYLVEIDNRLGEIFPPYAGTGASTSATYSFIDDDQIATYYLDSTVYLQDIPAALNSAEPSSIQGSRGNKLTFRIGASVELNSSTYLFTTLGSTATVALANGANTLAASSYYYLDSIVRVTGVNTGYRIDIPIRYIKTI